ncbi:MAG: HEAT repeat domain-containing protein [Polyangiaceae bacterium]
MRTRALTSILAAVLLLTVGDASARDFDAGGRHRPPKPNPGGGGGGGGPKPPKPAKPEPGGDPDATGKGPSQAVLIQRYTGIVLSQPGSIFPLQRLAQLYRERDGNLKKLVEEFESKAADSTSSDAWAAKVALAGIYKIEGRIDDAVKRYEDAIAERPKEAQPVMAAAQLLQDKGDIPGAKKKYEQALGLTSNRADKEQILRTMRTMALDAKDWSAASDYHKQLITLAGNSLFIRAELGRELMGRGQYDRAEEEFRDVAKQAAGDNRALAPALRDLGTAQAKQKKNSDALDTLKKALAIAGSEAGVRTEILNTIAEVYRAENNLAALITLMEGEHPTDFQRLVLLGSLYEETGQSQKAVDAYQKAISANAKNIETRVKIVRLLQGLGELDKAIAENEKLIQAAPKNPDFVFQLVEVLFQRGDRAKAMTLLTKLESTASHDEDVLIRLADYYERIDEKDKSTALYVKLTSVASGDPAHFVELGERYWQAGDKKKAMDTWARIRTVVPNKAKALTAMGEVYLKNDLINEALAAFKEAMDSEPGNLRLRRGYAAALEQAAAGSGNQMLTSARYDEARIVWEDVLDKAGKASDRNTAREARTHLVTLWSLLKQLESKVEPLKRKLNEEPPDIEAGRMLAEVQVKLRRLPEAEATLVKMTEKAPGDEEAFLSLERVRIMQQNPAGAILALEKLVEINPKRAREYYQRMAQYSAELYRDDDAIKYAAMAVALSPQDADGHRKLAEMYRRRQDFDRAIQEFRAAIAMNDRLFQVYFELAELLTAKGEAEEADILYRRVLRSAPDEEMIAQAGRLSMQRHLAKGTLNELEGDLLPLSGRRPAKLVYRRMPVETYGHMTFPLVQQIKFGNTEESDKAREQLVKIGARGVKPLLDALADEQQAQVRTAIDVLAYVENKGAGPALMSFALGTAEISMRVRAMVATGSLRDPALLTKYEALLAPKDIETVAPGDPVAVAAAWSVARMAAGGEKKALPLLDKMLDSGAPDVRALAAIGLGLAHEKGAINRIEALAHAPDAANITRAAAAVALGELGATASGPTLVELANHRDSVVRSAAYGALARLGDSSAMSVTLSALFAADASERRAAADALALLSSKPSVPPSTPTTPTKPTKNQPSQNTSRTLALQYTSSGSVDVREVVQALRPARLSGHDRVTALAAIEKEVAAMASNAAAASPEQAARVADALLSAEGASGAFAPFVEGVTLDDADTARAAKSAEVIRAATVPVFARLTTHPSASVKTKALRMLEGRNEDLAVKAIAASLADTNPDVVRAAILAAVRTPSLKVAKQTTQLLDASPSWAVRVLAADSLAAMVKREEGSALDDGWKALEKAALKDEFAFVREASIRSLVAIDKARAKAILDQIAEKDPEPQIREKASSLR